MKNEQKSKKHNGYGITSLVVVFISFIILYMAKRINIVDFGANPVYSCILILIYLCGLSICIILNITGIFFGILNICKKETKHVLGILGLIMNGFMVLFYIIKLYMNGFI